mmetsp:Transcript_21641/g.53668  ORF Transcript_21641/g.53668 Transcript_21641/m.53668 type:complete len:316 (+) Transcript_21641:1361-2308(+)
MPAHVNHNVAIVSVFQTQQVTDDRIGRQRLDKVALGRLETLRIGTSVGFFIISPKTSLLGIVGRFLQTIQRGGIDHEFQQPRTGGSAQNLVRLEPQRNPGGNKDTLVVMNHLHNKDFLSQIVVGFRKQTHDFELDLFVFGFVLDNFQHSKRLFGPGFAPTNNHFGTIDGLLVDISGVGLSLDDFGGIHYRTTSNVRFFANPVRLRDVARDRDVRCERFRRIAKVSRLGSYGRMSGPLAFQMVSKLAWNRNHGFLEEFSQMPIRSGGTRVFHLFVGRSVVLDGGIVRKRSAPHKAVVFVVVFVFGIRRKQTHSIIG